MQRKLLYLLKTLLQKNVALYSAVYQLFTLNLDYLRLKCGRETFPSRFGGLWTDGDQFERRLNEKLRSGVIGLAEADGMTEFRRNGILKLEGAIPGGLIDRYLSALDSLRTRDDTPLMVTSTELDGPIQYTREALTRFRSIRTVDDYFFLSAARDILFHPAVYRYLELLLGGPAMLTQSLNFVHGSQQGMHRDTAFVRMNSPMKLLGVWIALEDVTEGSGELIYFPGSHRWEDYLFSGRFKHYDSDRDGEWALDDNYLWIYRQAEERGIREEHFLPKKGDVIIWHADLAHGGADVTIDGATRRSLVGHFCPRNVKPLYAYYKPAQRKVYMDGARRYMSSYYRREGAGND